MYTCARAPSPPYTALHCSHSRLITSAEHTRNARSGNRKLAMPTLEELVRELDSGRAGQRSLTRAALCTGPLAMGTCNSMFSLYYTHHSLTLLANMRWPASSLHQEIRIARSRNRTRGRGGRGTGMHLPLTPGESCTTTHMAQGQQGCHSAQGLHLPAVLRQAR